MKEIDRNRRRILIFTNHFYPENFKVNDIAFSLADKGADVTVITSIPHYPNRKKFKKYTLFNKRKEQINNVKVIRLPLIFRGSGGKIRLVLTYLSFSIVSILYAFYIAIAKKFDVIFVHHTSPIFIGIPAIIVKKIQGIKLYFWNLDLWPEVFTATTKINKKHIATRILLYITKQIQKRVDFMMVSSKGHIPFMLKRGVTKDKILYYPNWAESFFFETPKKELPFEMPSGFNVVFAGNIGKAQDFDNVLRAILELKEEKHINWVLIGDGRAREELERGVKANNLSGNVILPGRYPIDYMPSVYKEADALLVSLVDEPIFTLPAKVQTYMASGTPILAMLNGEGLDLIRDINCGRSCSAGDYKSLAKNVLELSKLSEEELEMMGKNGYEYCQKNFHPDKCLDKLYKILSED